jgi:16S rRNA (guanine527-N7)-methyltransferase
MKRSAQLEAIAAALERHRAPAAAAEPLDRVLIALAAEPDPHTTVDPADAVDVHVADSLAGLAVPRLRAASSIADLGAGAGFPGLVLAAALPRARVDLIESASRKTALIERLAAAAPLANVGAVAARAEEWAAGEGAAAYDAVTARAVGPLAVLVEYAAPLLRLGGVLVAWKGGRSTDEESAGAAAAAHVGLRPADVLPAMPYPESSNRHLHVFEKVELTPERFPRRPGMAAKRPLA